MSIIEFFKAHTISENQQLSRREFLKLSSLGMAGLIMDPRADFEDLAPNQFGRVAEVKTLVYDRPSLEGSQGSLHSLIYVSLQAVITVYNYGLGIEYRNI